MGPTARGRGSSFASGLGGQGGSWECDRRLHNVPRPAPIRYPIWGAASDCGQGLPRAVRPIIRAARPIIRAARSIMKTAARRDWATPPRPAVCLLGPEQKTDARSRASVRSSGGGPGRTRPPVFRSRLAAHRRLVRGPGRCRARALRCLFGMAGRRLAIARGPGGGGEPARALGALVVSRAGVGHGSAVGREAGGPRRSSEGGADMTLRDGNRELGSIYKEWHMCLKTNDYFVVPGRRCVLPAPC